MKKNGFTEFLYKNAGYLAVALISVVYITSSLVKISTTEKTVIEIIGTGILSFIVGFLINSAFRSIGVRKGDESEKMISTVKLHGEAVEEIVPYIDRLDEFCDNENKNALFKIRQKILSSAGLRYDDCFDENGIAKEITIDCKNKDIREEKEKAYSKAIKVKIKPLLASNLTSDGVSEDNPFDFCKSKKQFTAQKNTFDIISRVLLAIIVGYFGVTFVSDADYATVIWNAMQIVMYIFGGVIQMYASYSWIVDDYRQSIIKKIDYLQKFKIFAERNAVENGKAQALSHMPTEN